MTSSTQNNTATTPRWFALSVHARSERRAATDLHAVVDDVFVPVSVERRAWSDRIKRVEAPLFPGYIFVRLCLSPERRVALLKCRGVIDVVGRMVGRADVAPAIDDDLIVSLQRLVASERALDPVTRLVPGTLVTVGAGPLRGVRGVVEEAADGQRRLIVQVSLLGRGVRATLLADDVLES
jgi:transcriptional antiterminator NusG